LDINEWLNDLGLGRYIPVFEDEGIDLEILPDYSEGELKELGIKGGHCKKILKAINSFDERSSEPVSKSTVEPPATVTPAPGLVSLIDSFPNVVAIPLQEYVHEDHPGMKLWAACDVVELLLRFLVTVGVADRRRDGELGDKLLKQLWGKIEMPTLGAWFAMARSMAENKSNKDLIVPEIDVYVMGIFSQLLYGSENPGTVETSFLALRNRLAHGGGLSRKEAERLIGIWREPFEKAIEALTWLSDVRIIGLDHDTPIELRGTSTQLNILPDTDMSLLSGDKDGIWVIRDGAILPLWPMALFGYPSTSTSKGSTNTGFENAAQIYVRKDVVSLQFTPLGADGFSQSEAGDTALEAFKSLFGLTKAYKQASEKRFKVQDFIKEIQKDASQMIGRHEEQEYIEKSFRDIEGGVVWLSGPAGIGKSFLIARIAQHLMEKFDGSDTIVLAYRFKAGDDSRCTRDAFANFVIERVIDQGALIEGVRVDDKGKAEDRLRSCLDYLSRDKKIIFVLDGLDEVLSRDKTFAEDIPLSLKHSRTTWVCAGRPEPSLQKAFNESNAITPYPDGLPPMRIKDIRGMLFEKIGPLRKKLLQKDKEIGGDIVNPFIELVAKRADGLPLYVKYVIGDVLSGRYTEFHGNVDLPETLHAYHEQLIDGLGIGDLKAVLTHLAATLAVALEPLADQEIVVFLTLRKLIPDDDTGRQLVAKGLAAMAPMLRRAPDPEGEEGFTLFHTSLREHILTTPSMAANVSTSKQAFAEAALTPEKDPSVTQYLYRTGIDHLIDAGMMEQAKQKLLEFEHLGKMLDLNVAPKDILRLWANLDDEPDALYETAVMEGKKLGQVAREASTFLTRYLFCWPKKPLHSLDDEPGVEPEVAALDAQVDELEEYSMELLMGGEPDKPDEDDWLDGLLMDATLNDAALEDPLFNRDKRVGYYIDPSLTKITDQELKKYKRLFAFFVECGFFEAAFVTKLTVCEYFYEKKGFDSIEAITTKAGLVDILRQKGKHGSAFGLYYTCLDVLLNVLDLTITDPEILKLLNSKYIKSMQTADFPQDFEIQINGEILYNGSDIIKRALIELKSKADINPFMELELNISLASMLFYENKLEEAKALSMKNLEIISNLYGMENVKRLEKLNLIANILIEQAHCEEAEILLKDAISLSEIIYGPLHFLSIETTVNLITALAGQGNYKTAQETVSNLMKLRGVQKIKNFSLDRIIYVLRNFSEDLLGRLNILQETVRANIDNHGIEHQDTFQSLEILCEFYFKFGLEESAISLLKNLIESERKTNSNFSSRILDKHAALTDIFYNRRQTHPSQNNLNKLTARKERILRMFYGIGMNSGCTIKEISEQFDVSEKEIQSQICESFFDMRANPFLTENEIQAGVEQKSARRLALEDQLKEILDDDLKAMLDDDFAAEDDPKK
jgi:hypothetical protein